MDTSIDNTLLGEKRKAYTLYILVCYGQKSNRATPRNGRAKHELDSIMLYFGFYSGEFSCDQPHLDETVY